jgi:hypothetical protein
LSFPSDDSAEALRLTEPLCGVAADYLPPGSRLGAAQLRLAQPLSAKINLM